MKNYPLLFNFSLVLSALYVFANEALEEMRKTAGDSGEAIIGFRIER
jgi:hypothetical protein